MSRFYEAAEFYGHALALIESEGKKAGFKVNNVSKIIGNLQFRKGWSIIKSNGNLDSALSLMEKADANLKTNFDLKMKLAQLYF